MSQAVISSTEPLRKKQPGASVVRSSWRDFSVLRREGSLGSASPRVHFAHATGFNAMTYRAMFGMFDPRLDVHALDLRGHGMTSAPANPRELTSWRVLAKDLVEWVEDQGEPVVLAGHSMGAALSLAAATRVPELVRSVVLVDPVFMPYAAWPAIWFARLFGWQRYFKIARSVEGRRVDFDSVESAVEHFTGRGVFRRWQQPWVEDYVRGGSLPTQDGIRLTCSAEWESRVFAQIDYTMLRCAKDVRCPVTLLLAGPSSPTRKPALLEFMRLAPHARVVITSNVSHFIPMERPEFVRDEVQRLAL